MESAAQHIETPTSFDISVDKSVFLKSISKLQSIVEKRNTIPILSNVKIEAQTDGIILTVTDMDIVASEKISGETNVAGILTVPALTLYDILRKLPENSKVNLASEDNSSRLIVSSGSSRFTLSYLPADDFPVMSEGDLTHKFSVKAEDFFKLLEKTKFAMSSEETRYYLNGVYLHLNGNKLRAVATDGHRLASVEIDQPEGAAEMPGIIIPRKTVSELAKLFESQEQIAIELSDSKIKFHSGDIEILSKVIDGTFPDYQRVIPENNTKMLKVSADDFKEAVDRVSTISADKTKAIKVTIENNNINLLSQGIEGASGKEDVQADFDADDKVEIGFNSRYVLEMMQNISGENVHFALNDSNAPALVTDPGDSSVLYIIMPMRV